MGPERAWHAVLSLIVTVALVAQIVLVIDAGTSLVDFISYFTIQSNLLVLVTSALIASGRPLHGTPWRLLRLAALVGITVTGVVYTVAIGPYVDFDGVRLWCDYTFHYVVPVAAVAGYVLFTDRDRFAWRDLAFVIWPVAWLGYTLVRAEIGSPRFATPSGGLSRYPYDFLDVDVHGAGSVAVAALVITVVLLGVAALYVRTSRAAGAVRDDRP